MSTSKPKIERPLTTKQKAFAIAWVDLLAKGKENGTEAARIAGYKPRKDSAKARPLPFDEDLKPSPAWSAMAKAFERKGSR